MRTGNRATRYKRMPMIEIHTIKLVYNRAHNKVNDRAHNKAHNRAYNRAHNRAHNRTHNRAHNRAQNSAYGDLNSYDRIHTWQNSHIIEYAHNRICVLEST